MREAVRECGGGGTEGGVEVLLWWVVKVELLRVSEADWRWGDLVVSWTRS